MTFGTPRSRTNDASVAASVSKTSPKTSNAGTPAARAAARIFGIQAPKIRAVDVLGGVDPEAVDLVRPYPVAPDLREPVHDERLLGEDVVEPEEVPLLEAPGRAGRELDVAAVVVAPDVVQPRRALEAALLRKHDRLARLVAGRKARKPLAARVALGRVRLALAVAVRRLLRRAVARPAREQDDVRGVVDDDVEVDLQPEAVRALDERREVRVRPEVRIDSREVEPPVPVVRRAVSLHPLLDDDRREPDRREAESLDRARDPSGRPRRPRSAPSGRRRGTSRCPSGRSR